jgi:flavin-binding protein dodecin
LLFGRRASDRNEGKEETMAVAKILEISARSDKSFEDAVRQGIARANETIKHVEGAWVEEQKVIVHEGEIRAFEVIMKVTFLLER